MTTDTTDPVAQTNLAPSDLTPYASTASTPALTPSSSAVHLTSAAAARPPPPPTTIRAARAGDAAAIAALGHSVFLATFAHTCSAADMDDYLASNFVEDVIAAELAMPDKAFIVVETADEQLVAFSALRTGTTEPCLAAYTGLVELQRVYVDNEFHGSGIARRLLDATCAEARDNGHTNIWLGVWEGNHRALKFYEKYGFVQVGSHDFWLGQDLQVDLIMVMPL